jgi:hypothetical protein
MKRTRFALTLILLVSLPLGLGAQALPLIYNPTDARTASLGGAGVALHANAWAIDANLAAAALSKQSFAAGLAYSYWMPGLLPDSRLSFGGWYQSGAFAFGLSGKGNFSQPADLYGPESEPRESVSPRDLSLALGAAWMPVPGLALSVTGRFISSVLGEQVRGTAFCADLALQYAYGPVRAGFSASNLSGPILYGDTRYPFPARIRGGATYTNLWIDATLEAEYLAQAGMMATVGIEGRPLEQVGQPRSWLALRAAYHYGPADRGLPAFASAGIGLYFSGLELDLAVLFASPALSGTVSAGLSYSF